MGLAQQDRKSSTFAENVTVEQIHDPADLTHADIGTTVAIVGKDITLGQRSGEPVLHTGELHEFRAAKNRIVVVLLMRAQHRQFRQPRVIETMPG